MGVHLHLSDLALDHLAGSDRLAEGDAVVSAGEGDLEHTLAHTEVRSSDVSTGNRQGVDSDLHAHALFAEQVLLVKLHVGELEAGVSSTASAHHVGHRGNFVARGVNGDEESGETLVALLGGIGHSDDVSEFAAVGVRDEPLLAVEDVVAILVLLSGGVDVSTGAAGLLGQSEAGEDGLVLELVHVLGLELVRTVVVEDAPVQVSCIVQVHTHAARTTGELLLNAQDVELRKIPSTVLSGESETIQVVFLGQLVELLGEDVRHLDLGLHLLERTLCELLDLLEIRVELLLGQFAHVNPP